jgi:VWFA-related protein
VYGGDHEHDRHRISTTRHGSDVVGLDHATAGHIFLNGTLNSAELASGTILYAMRDTSSGFRTLIRLGALIAAIGPGGASVDGTAAQVPAPTQAALDTVAVDFLAVTTDGQPVLGLTSQEVQLRIDGRARPLKWLEWIPVAEAPPVDASSPAITPMPPPFGSNAASDAGRSFVIAIEDDSFRPGRERPLRAAIDRFLGALSSRDRVAVVTMPYGGFKVNLTNDHERVRTEVAKIGGQGSSSETGSEMACRTRRTLESLVGLVSGFAGLDGSTTVMFFSSGMAGPRRDAVITLAPGMCELTVDMFAALGAAAGAARANFYVIQPEDLMISPGANQIENIAGTGFKGSDNPLEGIEHLAGVTGAERLHLSATGDATLLRIARETSAYYVLGFDPLPGDRNGASRQMDVRVARPGVVVRVRPNITMARRDTRAAKPQTVTPRTMLREGRTFRELPLRGVGYVSSNVEDGRLKVVVLAEPTEASVQLTAAAAGLFDENGRLVAQWTAESKHLAAGNLLGALVAPRPGTYRVRVAATDAEGRSGSADYEVDAALANAGSLKVSSLVLGLSRGGSFLPRMQFSAEPVVLGYMDIYGRPEGQVAVTAEIARSVNGPAIGTPIPGAVKPVDGEDRLIATVAVPIGALPPGDYVVRVTVGVPGQPAGRVLRTLRKLRA